MTGITKADVATVGELEALIHRLKQEGRITAETRLSGIDADGCTSGMRPCTAYVFEPTASGIGDHHFAIWGNYPD